MAEAGFEIDGKVYPVPEIGSFDMDEAQRLYDLADVVLEDFALPDPDASEEEQIAFESEILAKTRNPAFKRAIVEVAYARGNPGLSKATVRETVAGLNMATVLFGFAEEEAGDDASPPDESASTTPPVELSSSEPDDLNTSSGSGSTITSPTEPDEILALTGATK